MVPKAGATHKKQFGKCTEIINMFKMPEYLYANNGKNGQYRCKVCQYLFNKKIVFEKKLFSNTRIV